MSSTGHKSWGNDQSSLTVVSLDIETTGLDPEKSQVRAVGLSANDWSAALIGRGESTLLTLLESLVSGLPTETVIATWNGEEFDFPFLHRRFALARVRTSLALEPKPGRGKYNGPLFSATWGGRRHIDIAPLYRETAAARGIQWSLKPVARAELGVTPVEVDRAGDKIAELQDDALQAYVSSDAAITLELATEALRQRWVTFA